MCGTELNSIQNKFQDDKNNILLNRTQITHFNPLFSFVENTLLSLSLKLYIKDLIFSVVYISSNRSLGPDHY